MSAARRRAGQTRNTLPCFGSGQTRAAIVQHRVDRTAGKARGVTLIKLAIFVQHVRRRRYRRRARY